MVETSFLSIDWDYFIEIYKPGINSYRETMQDILGKWYKEYFMALEENIRLEEDYSLGEIYEEFIDKILPHMKFKKDCMVTLTESHEDAYEEVQKSGEQTVCLLDAHSDLGYGGLGALNYEVNCANWLGKLLKEGTIKQGFIVYSPYTKEYPEEFKEITDTYSVEFITIEQLLEKGFIFNNVHICRSGPWTPPWYDEAFYNLAKALKMPVRDEVGLKRNWQPEKLSLADRINYRMGVI